MSIKFIKDTAERAVTAFVAAYMGVWVEAGSDFDALTNVDNLKDAAFWIGVIHRRTYEDAARMSRIEVRLRNLELPWWKRKLLNWLRKDFR